MTLLRPAGLAALALAIPIVALYVLRLKRPERAVSSTLLWRGIVEDMRANAPWQRLHPSLLLVVQLATVVALALALAQPAVTHSQEFAGDVVLILDQSYSMQATDGAPTRFAQAQARARSIASRMASSSAISVIGMGKQPTLAIAQSSDAGAIGGAINALRPGDRSVNQAAALSLAASLARPGRQTQAVILTDRSSGLTSTAFHLPYPLEIIRFGAIRRDLGIADFSAAAGTYTHALIRIENFGATAASSDLNLYSDGQLLDVRPVSLPPGSSTSLAWDRLPAGLRKLEARLTIADNMPADKTAWAVVPSAVQRRVVLVSQSDYYLETALALDPSISLQVVSPVAYDAAPSTGADVVVFDGAAPSPQPHASTLLVNPPPGSAAGIDVGGPQPGGLLSVPPGASAPLARYAALSDVHVARTRRLATAPWLHTLLRAGSSPAVLAGQHGSYREAVIGFALQDSDWPLRLSFPVYIHALIQYLAPGITLGTTSIQAGDVLPVFASPGTSTLQITRPDGTSISLHAPFHPYADTLTPGIYRAESKPAGLGPVLIAVNSFPPNRPDVSGPALSLSRGTAASSAHAITVPADISWAAGLLILVLLGTEWWLAMRS